MNNLIIGKSQTISAIIPSTPALGVVAPFQDIPFISLNNIRVYGIEAFTADQAAADEAGLNVIQASDAPNLTVTLVTSDGEKIAENMPYYDLIRSNNGGFITLLNDFKLDLTKCYMTLVSAGGMSVNEVGLFTIYYDFI